jgi:hypothetical protein
MDRKEGINRLIKGNGSVKKIFILVEGERKDVEGIGNRGSGVYRVELDINLLIIDLRSYAVISKLTA